jgi:hypothetical protein|tara:strand:+ start:2282 stop:3142 length:861 start_codon:yes stop_codon:yes gene_type:complete
MANKKLTDLGSITTLSDDDVLYIVDPDLNASLQVTYGDLINTKFKSLSTNFLTVSAGLGTLSNSVSAKNRIDYLSAAVGGPFSSSTPIFVDGDGSAAGNPGAVRDGAVMGMAPIVTNLEYLSGRLNDIYSQIALRALQSDFVTVESDLAAAKLQVQEDITTLTDELTAGGGTLSAVINSSDNLTAFPQPNSVGELPGFQRLRTTLDSIHALTAGPTLGNGEVMGGATTIKTIFDNIGVNTSTLKFNTPTASFAGRDDGELGPLKDSISFIPITIGSDTFRLLLSAT